MWYPIKRTERDTNNTTYSDAEMVLFILNGAGNGWTAVPNEDGTVSAFKDGRHIRDYRQENNN